MSDRATRRSRLDVTVQLAVALPLLLALVLLAVRPSPSETPPRASEQTPLGRSTLVCPSALGDAPEVALSAAEGIEGAVEVGAPEPTTVDVSGARVATAEPGTGPVVLTASDALAPELVAGRAAESPLAAADCRPVAASHWFTGAAAGPTHSSVLELVNPNPGPAVADVTVLGPEGPLEVPTLRGIAVDGNSSATLDLGRTMPRRGALALHVTVARGQLGVTLRDRVEELVGGPVREDWLPAQAEPATSHLLLGLPTGAGGRTLTVANPGDSEVRVTLRLVTPDSVFVPEGAPELSVAPGTVAEADLAELLGSEVAQGAVGLVVEASGPVTAALRSAAAGDLALTAPVGPFTAATAVLLPPGDKRVVLGGADAVGVATVLTRAADGSELSREPVELQPELAAVVTLPDGAVRLEVVPERTGVAAAVVATGRGGTAVLGLRELVRADALPDVAPGLP